VGDTRDLSDYGREQIQLANGSHADLRCIPPDIPPAVVDSIRLFITIRCSGYFRTSRRYEPRARQLDQL
jgi:hypothetical protein